MVVNIKRVDGTGVIPKYQTSGSAGFDLHASLDETFTLEPGEVALIPTGIAVQLSEGYELQVRPRSGLAIKSGITVLNSPGTVDSDFIGEIKVILINTGKYKFMINSGDRIAQGVVSKYERVEFKEVSELVATERGAGSFGSTGNN